MKTFAIVGCGDRALQMYGKPLTGRYKHQAKLIGVYDNDDSSIAGFTELLEIEEIAKNDYTLKPDYLIICTPDYSHAQMIREWLPRCDVICEKPLCISERDKEIITSAIHDSSYHLFAIENYRYVDLFSELKKVLPEIGPIHYVDYRWELSHTHGGDYFRRWHKWKSASGGLLLTKAVHHFDLLNWWLDQEPQEVSTVDMRKLYFGKGHNEVNCRTCKNTCSFYWDLESSEEAKALYSKSEYIRDQCVWAEGDVEDFYSLRIHYPETMVNYSLNAFSPFEGMRIVFYGGEGQIECSMQQSYVPAPNPTDSIVITKRGTAREIKVQRRRGQHWGADADIHEIIFSGEAISKSLFRVEDAFNACNVGIWANFGKGGLYQWT